MLTVPVKDLLEAGVHFGCRASRWNPKMKPYIFGRRNQIHIINLKETLRGLIKATSFLHRLAAEGQQVLFVGTKRQAQQLVTESARKVSMPFVAERWLGGTLTNFTTVRQRLARLEELETMEAKGASLSGLSKKAMAALMREKRKIFRNLDGLRSLDKLPGALVIIDPKKEHNAVKEASKLGIPTVAILDTDCDPTEVDIPIPANDDAMRSIGVILSKLTESVASGSTAHAQFLMEEEKRREEESARRAAEDRRGREEAKRRAAEREAQNQAVKEAAAKYRQDKAKETPPEGDKPAAE